MHAVQRSVERSCLFYVYRLLLRNRKHVTLQPNEVDAFLATAVEVEYHSSSDLQQLEVLLMSSHVGFCYNCSVTLSHTYCFCCDSLFTQANPYSKLNGLMMNFTSCSAVWEVSTVC